jgi:hypothetical protein
MLGTVVTFIDLCLSGYVTDTVHIQFCLRFLEFVTGLVPILSHMNPVHISHPVSLRHIST